ncbi:leucine-rich repeat domain-containing protein [Mediterraneibacter agrestimuris]|uniref:leucine-rich repeat domain-containing protein n=1 Tax=Mediterraneibacter agrestimuris TaxID=2941333 RepID=UPI002040BAA7|nr:leucine-rich repeat domain-containing protein [Mediterraneibacter agrestimuris]
MKNRIKLVCIPEIGICDDGILSCSREKNYSFDIAKAAIVTAGFLAAMEVLAPLHTQYAEPDTMNYSIKEIPEVKKVADTKFDLMFHSKAFAGDKASGSFLKAGAKLEEWKESTELFMLTEIAMQIPVVEITMEETAPEESFESVTGVLIPEIDIPKENIIISESDDINELPGDLIISGRDDTEELKEDVIVPDTGFTEDIDNDIVLPGDDMPEENEIGDITVPKEDTSEDVVTPGDDDIEDDFVTDGPAVDESADDIIMEDDSNTEEIPETPAAPAGFLIDGEGMICGSDGALLAATDGYLELPSEECVGIRSGAFAEIGTGITEIYIPPNISIIEEGAFSGMHFLEWIEAAAGNPGCVSIDGVLFDRNGTTLLTFPGGRMDMYVVPAEVTRIASGAFEDTAISRLDFWQCKAIELGENIFGVHNGNGIEVRAPEEHILWYQEIFAGYDVLIL